MAKANTFHALVLLILAASVCRARDTPGQRAALSSSSHHQQRLLLGDKKVHHSSKHHHEASAHKQARAVQLDDEVTDVPPFVGADVPRMSNPTARLPPSGVPPRTISQFNGGGGQFNGGGGTPNWLNVAGVTVNAVDYGVNVGTALLAPLVNGVASNIPLMAPSLPDGSCLRGTPMYMPRMNAVMCVVGNGAAVTNYLFNAANVLVGATGQGLSLAGQIASLAGKK